MVLVIAEAGVNHNGDVKRACEMVKVAAEAGADYVKFQAFVPHNLASFSSPKTPFLIASTGTGSQIEWLTQVSLPFEAYFEIKQCCYQYGIGFMSSVFDMESLNFMVDECGVDSLKIGSSELTNSPLLFHAGLIKKKIFLSTGMSTLEEIRLALSSIAFGSHKRQEPSSLKELQASFDVDELSSILSSTVTLMHCTANYPTPLSEVNLRAMKTLQDTFSLPVGYSDHTQGNEVAIAAVAVGADVIEKHFTLDRSLSGPQHIFSLEPQELKLTIQTIRAMEDVLGEAVKQPTAGEASNLRFMRKSLFTACKIKKGELFTAENLTLKRPAEGVSPWLYWDYLGTPADQDYEADMPVAVLKSAPSSAEAAFEESFPVNNQEKVG